MRTTTNCALSTCIQEAYQLVQLRKTGICEGDVVFVKTKNSVYTLRVIGGGMYTVSGGWFDQQGLSGMKVGVRGCTWGGSIIKVDLVAACGLCLEFTNRVVTSPIESFVIVPRLRLN